ncbi:MAG: tRNA 2-methylthioadenosine synthase -like protein [Deltaproteobacteria bacterium]|nr:tRNA 2-methylthioadenosine synthase -like protein [Deltaproteobacteria bacterium]
MDREDSLRICLITLGCKTNQTDAASLAAELTARGHTIVSSKANADAFVIHTCTVTHKTDYQARQAVRQVVARNPEARVVVTGCYAQVSPEPLQAIAGVDYVVQSGKRDQIPEILLSRGKQKNARLLSSGASSAASFIEEPLPLFSDRTRAFLKVQDGCNSFCSYCIVPHARGRNRSLPLGRAMAQANELASSGFREIILTGIHLGAYGEDLFPPVSLLDLLLALERAAGIPRIRLSSIEPGEFNSSLIEFLSRSDKICPHLHVPLQSGDDEVLKRMNRRYSRSFFEDLIRRLHRAIPDLAVGMDVIGGFPGEDDRAFENTYDLISRLPIAYLHVFPFSKREGTPAARFPNQVPGKTIKTRCLALRELGAKKRKDFYRDFLGKNLKVLIESKRERETGLLKGFSPNYIPVLADGGDGLINQEVDIEVTEVRGEKVFGKIV